MSKYVKRFISDSLVGGQVITFLNAFAILIFVAIFSDRAIGANFLIVIFLLSASMYFFDFFEDQTDDNFSLKRERSILSRQKSLFIFLVSISVILAAVITFYFGAPLSFLFLLSLFAIGLSYPVFLKKLTTIVPAFKDILVAVGWNMLVLFYFVFYSYPVTHSVIALLVLILIRDFVNVCFCDIKDADCDKKNGLRTMAVIAGKERTMKILHVLNVISAVAVIIFYLLGFFAKADLFLLVPILLTSIFIQIGHNRNNYSTIMVDFEFYAWLAVAVLFVYL